MRKEEMRAQTYNFLWRRTMFYTKYSSVYTEVLFQLSLLLFSDAGSLCVDQDYLKFESLPPRRPECPLLKVDFSSSNCPLMVVHYLLLDTYIYDSMQNVYHQRSLSQPLVPVCLMAHTTHVADQRSSYL